MDRSRKTEAKITNDQTLKQKWAKNYFIEFQITKICCQFHVHWLADDWPAANWQNWHLKTDILLADIGPTDMRKLHLVADKLHYPNNYSDIFSFF